MAPALRCSPWSCWLVAHWRRGGLARLCLRRALRRWCASGGGAAVSVHMEPTDAEGTEVSANCFGVDRGRSARCRGADSERSDLPTQFSASRAGCTTVSSPTARRTTSPTFAVDQWRIDGNALAATQRSQGGWRFQYVASSAAPRNVHRTFAQADRRPAGAPRVVGVGADDSVVRAVVWPKATICFPLRVGAFWASDLQESQGERHDDQCRLPVHIRGMEPVLPGVPHGRSDVRGHDVSNPRCVPRFYGVVWAAIGITGVGHPLPGGCPRTR